MALPIDRSGEKALWSLLAKSDCSGRFISDLLFYLRSSYRGCLFIWRLSLTMPEWEPDRGRLLCAMRSLANEIAAEPAGGAWLVLDVTEQGREHAYGIALSSRSRDWFITAWVHLTGATRSACHVRPVSGQLKGWGGSDGKAARTLETNLARVVRYGLKTLPARSQVPLAQRVVVSGPFERLWQPVPATEAEQRAPEQVEPSNVPAAGAERCCQRCRVGLQRRKRKHALWCSASCRTMAWMQRQTLRQQLTAEELDAFEERAAILEWDGRLDRAHAEQQAFEDLRKARFPRESTSTVSAAAYGQPN